MKKKRWIHAGRALGRCRYYWSSCGDLRSDLQSAAS